MSQEQDLAVMVDDQRMQSFKINNKVHVIYRSAEQARQLVLGSINKNISTAIQFNTLNRADFHFSRHHLYKTKWIVTLTGSANNLSTTAEQILDTLVVRDHPLQRCCDNINMRLNASEESFSAKNLVPLLTRFRKPELSYERLDTMNCGYPDIVNNGYVFQGYRPAGTNVGELAAARLYGNDALYHKNPHATKQNTPYSRMGACKLDSIIEDQAAGAGSPQIWKLTITTCEESLHPFSSDDPNETLFGLHEFNVFASVSNLLCAFQMKGAILETAGPGNAFFSVSDVKIDDSKMLLSYWKYNTVPKQQEFSYKFYKYLQVHRKQETLENADVNSSILTGSLNTNVIPDYILLALVATPEMSPQNLCHNYDCFGSLTSLKVVTDKSDVAFSSADPLHLFEISSKAGCNMTKRQWTDDVGSLMCIDVKNSDLAGYTAGENVANQALDFQVSAKSCRRMRNTWVGPAGSPGYDESANLVLRDASSITGAAYAGSKAPYELVILYLQTATLTLVKDTNSSRVNIGINTVMMDSSRIIDADEIYPAPDYYAGKWYTPIDKFFKKAFGLASRALPIGETIVNSTPALANNPIARGALKYGNKVSQVGNTLGYT